MSWSPVHVVDAKGMRNPDAKFITSQCSLGGNSQRANGSLSKRTQTLHLKRSRLPVVKLEQAKAKWGWFVSMTKLHFISLFGSIEWSLCNAWLILDQNLNWFLCRTLSFKHGFMYEMGGINKITSFNESSNPVDGLMDCKNLAWP